MNSSLAGLRKLLRCKRTKAFLASDGTWTYDIAKARSLSGRDTQAELRAQFRSGQFEFYYSFDESGESSHDFALAVR